jgi:hypothetical protein
MLILLQHSDKQPITLVNFAQAISSGGHYYRAHPSTWSDTAGRRLGHREGERSKKGYGENRGKSVSHCHGRVPQWLPKPNEPNRKRHDRQRERNNCNCAKDNERVLARYKLGSHGLNPFAHCNEFAR